MSGLDPNSMGFLDPYPDPVTINKISVADPDPGSDAFLTPGPDPGYRIGFFFGSRIPTPYFLELSVVSDKFLCKNSSIIL